jgi:ABC-type nitrate/sulfonate/bicarbonate transport system substrate-binding protein
LWFFFRSASEKRTTEDFRSPSVFNPLQVIVCLVLLVSWNAFAQAQPAKVKVGYSAISEVDLPAWVAKETKIFEKNGLDVQLIYFTGGTTAVLALVSGEVPICQVAGPAIVNSALGGADILMVKPATLYLDVIAK